jgi:hypothetical protein
MTFGPGSCGVLVVVGEVDVYFSASHLVTEGGTGFVTRSVASRRAQPPEDVALEAGVLGLGQLTRLEFHLAIEQDFPETRLIVHLGVGRTRYLVQHESKATDEQRVEDEHVRDRLKPAAFMPSRASGGC